MTTASSTTTSSASEPIAAPDGGTERIPEQFPPFMAKPQPTWRPHWTAVPFLLPLVFVRPRWLSGPIGVGSLWTAFVAHVVSWFFVILCAGMMVGMGEYLFDGNAVGGGVSPSYIHLLLYGVVEIWLTLMVEFVDWHDFVDMTAGAVLSEIGFLVLAVVLAPWIARGERRWRMWLRSLKIVLWATIGLSLMPISLAVIFTGMFFLLPYELSDGLGNVFQEILVTLLCVNPLVLLWMLARLGEQYCGPPVGRLYEPHALRCRDCGYELTFMEHSANCPECNLSIALSLPNRRPTPAFVRAASVWRQIREYPALWWQSLRGRRFGLRLPVFNAHRGAWRFLGMTAGVVGVFGMLAILIGGELLNDYDYERGLSYVIASTIFRLTMTFCLTASGTMLMVLVVGCVLSGFGWSEPERKTTVVAYSSGWLAPCAVCVCFGVGWARLLPEVWPGTRFITYEIAGQHLDLLVMLACAGFLPAAGCLLMWFVQIYKMMRATRYASA